MRVSSFSVVSCCRITTRRPAPSPRDVRLAFETSVLYFIIGLDRAGRATLRAFRIFEAEGRWERAEFAVADE